METEPIEAVVFTDFVDSITCELYRYNFNKTWQVFEEANIDNFTEKEPLDKIITISHMLYKYRNQGSEEKHSS